MHTHLFPLESEIEIMISEKRYNDAIANILVGVHNHFKNPEFARSFLYYPGLDNQIQKISAALAASCPSDTESTATENTLIIASEMFPVGGHSRVIADIVREVQSPTIVLTDMLWNYRRAPDHINWLLDEFSDISVIPLIQTTLWEKCRSLFLLTQRLRPNNILYFNHHEDPIPFIGTLGYTKARKTLVHHCDHNPSLGNTIEGMRHVDFTKESVDSCSVHLKRQCSLLPLYVQDQGLKTFSNPIDKPVSVATSGANHKYARSGEYALQEIVRTVLSNVNGHFFHIGHLADDWIAEIRSFLNQNNIDPNRYIPLGNVKSVWLTLKELDAHLYLASAPIGGGRAAIEAQGCGYPVLYVPIKDQGPAIGVDSIFANRQLAWTSFDGLAAVLEDAIRCHDALSTSARNMYDLEYSNGAFKKAVVDILSLDNECHINNQ